MKRVVLITGHYYQSKRKAGFHWLADAFHSRGDEILFLTAPISTLSRIKRDFRFDYPIREQANRLLEIHPRLFSYIHYTPFHPANLRLRLFNHLASSIWRKYDLFSLGAAAGFIASSDVIIFESTPALLLFDRCKKLNPHARYVYRVSDDLRLLKNHDVVLQVESRIAKQFNLISVPSKAILDKFRNVDMARLQPHGIQQERFDRPSVSPYDNDFDIQCVFAGNSHFDDNFLHHAVMAKPTFAFHIIGNVGPLPNTPNLFRYGELTFDQTIPYIKHADIGLQIRSYQPNIESLTDSLKVMQYTYCRLPIVAPDFLRSERPNLITYQPDKPKSIASSLDAAAQFPRNSIDPSSVRSWNQLASELADDEGTPSGQHQANSLTLA